MACGNGNQPLFVVWMLFHSGTYVLVITSRKEAGNFLGFPVYRVNSMKFLYCNEALKYSTSQEVVLYYFFLTPLFHAKLKGEMLLPHNDSPFDAEKR